VTPEGHVPIAVVDRNGLDESVHHGCAVVLGASGEVLRAVGDHTQVVFGRSCLKPLQAAAMARTSVRLEVRQWALACASHDGSPVHLDVVRSTLAAAGLDERVLATTPDLPYDRVEADRVLLDGGGPSALAMNCSGKHAAFIATCVAEGWDVDGHLTPTHPLQQHITAVIDELCAADGGVRHVGVDGCGAPTHAMALVGLARALHTVARDVDEVRTAMTSHPVLVAGPTRPATMLMTAVPGLIAKDGAEGVFIASLPGVATVVVKVADGAVRAGAPVVASLLRRAGVAVPTDLDSDLAPPARGAGAPVGRVRSLV
jgi:L-asparaginase II